MLGLKALSELKFKYILSSTELSKIKGDKKIMGDRFGAVTKYTFTIIGLLLLVGIVGSYFVPGIVPSIQWILGIASFILVMLLAIDAGFGIKGGIPGTVSLAILGVILLAVGIGAFGLSLESAAQQATIGTITPALATLIQTLSASIGFALISWGVIGTVKQLM